MPRPKTRLSAKEAGERLGISATQVTYLARKHKIPTEKSGHKIYNIKSLKALRRLREERGKPVPPSNEKVLRILEDIKKVLDRSVIVRVR